MSAASGDAEKSSLSGASFRRLKVLVWFKERAHPTELQVTLIWAGIIGFGGAVGSVGFRFLTGSISKTDLILALADINRSGPDR